MKIFHLAQAKMSVLQKTHDVDLEAARINDNVVNDGIGSAGAGVSAASGGGAPPVSSDVKEIVENNASSGKDSKERRVSNVSECSVVIVDLDPGVAETRLCLAKIERDCRICHLSLWNEESGVPIELGCSCKDDLAAAHKHCAEAWFKIKGNRTCEICGSIAQNVAGVPEAELVEQWSEANDAPATVAARVPLSESRNFWKGHRFLNFLLACVVFAFVLSWLFHFNIPS